MAKSPWIVGGAAVALAGLVALPLLGAVIFLGGLLSAFGLGSQTAHGRTPPNIPPLASAQALPAEWLPLIRQEDPGVPNTLVAAIMAAGSGGQVFGDTYYCSNGYTATAACSTVYHPGLLGVGAYAHTVGIARGLLNLRGAPHNPPRNLAAGAAALAGLRAGYLQDTLAAFHRYDQAPPGWAGTGQDVATVRSDLATYAAPVLGAWSLGGWAHGTWQDPHDQPEWVLVVAAAPTGPPWTLTWGPPICTTPPHGGPRTCIPDTITGHTLELPSAVTATLPDGHVVYLDPSTKIAAVPHWPGAVVWGAKLPFAQGITLTAYWPPDTVATLSFPNAWAAVGVSGPVGTESATGVWSRWQSIIAQASAATGVPAAWIAAEILHESGGNPTAGSPAGAYGLMQLEPSTAVAYGCLDRADPLCNVMAGARYLAALYQQFRSWRGASAGYYGGGGTEAAALQAAGLHPPVPWATAAGALNVVPDPQAGNTLTLAAYANAIYATAEQLIQQQHLPAL